LDTYLDALQGFPNNADTLQTTKGNATLVKKDIFKNLMWYMLPDSSLQYPLTITRVKEIIRLNSKGERPDDLQPVDLTSNKQKEEIPAHVELVGQISLNTLERNSKKRKDKDREIKSGERKNEPQQQRRTEQPQNKGQQQKPEKRQQPQQRIAEGKQAQPKQKASNSNNTQPQAPKNKPPQSKRANTGGNSNPQPKAPQPQQKPRPPQQRPPAPQLPPADGENV
jgi:hypothetical protein